MYVGLGRLCARADSFTTYTKTILHPVYHPIFCMTIRMFFGFIKRERGRKNRERERERDIIGKKLYFLYNKVIKIKNNDTF